MLYILLQNGSIMHFHLGKLFKKRYTVENNLFSPNYTRAEVYVRSTDYDRTLMSGSSLLRAIFSPDEDQVSSVFNAKYIAIFVQKNSQAIKVLWPVQSGHHEQLMKSKVVAKNGCVTSKI